MQLWGGGGGGWLQESSYLVYSLSLFEQFLPSPVDLCTSVWQNLQAAKREREREVRIPFFEYTHQNMKTMALRYACIYTWATCQDKLTHTLT